MIFKLQRDYLTGFYLPEKVSMDNGCGGHTTV
jgi:hypothetical protein